MRTTIRRTSVVALSAMAFALVTPLSVRAQAGPGPRWLGWLGCWSAAPADRPAETGPDAPRIVCITPTNDVDVVDISAIAEGKIVSRDRIDASGRTQTIDNGGCHGTQSARWSGDGRRVFLKSSVSCDGLPTEMSAILAMTPSGGWLDVRRVAAGSGSDVRVARYRDVGLPSGIPPEIASALNPRGNFLMHDARLDTSAPAGPGAIIEASRSTDASVVEAWVVESGQPFVVDARTLTQLADAGVPARVTDAMIRVSTPTEVSDRSSKVYYGPYGWNGYDGYGRYGAYGRGSADAWNQGTSSRVTVNIYSPYDPWGFGFWPYGYQRGYGYVPFGYGIRYGNGGRFGDPYGYGSGYGYGYGYGFGYGNGYPYGSGPRNRIGYYYPPVIVLHNDPTNTAPRGRSTKGEGYSPGVRQADNSEPREARPRTTAGSVVDAVMDAARGSGNNGNSGNSGNSAPRSEPRSEPRAATAAPRTAKGRP